MTNSRNQTRKTSTVKASIRLLHLLCALIFLLGISGLSQSAGQANSTPGKVVIGSYKCWAYGQPRMLLNFTIRDATQYTGSDGKAGTYSFDSKTTRIVFKGGFLDGVMPKGFYTIYHEPQGMPTVSFRGPSNSEASYCQGPH
jgi:hypothetical protein